MHSGSLESTQEARVALGYRFVQILHIFRALQTSRVHPQLDIRTLSMNKFLCISQFQMRPDPQEFAFFFLWMANSRGRGHLSCQMPTVETKVDGKCHAIHNGSNAACCERRQFMHTQSSRSCYIRVQDLIK